MKFKLLTAVVLLIFSFSLNSEAGILDSMKRLSHKIFGGGSKDQNDNGPIDIAHHASAFGTTPSHEVKELHLMPRGSAVVTSSGALEEEGITQIIHAATGSMLYDGPAFDPTVEGVYNSIKNAVHLAKLNDHKRLAIPFVGGSIFIHRMGVDPQFLASTIVRAALEQREDLEIRFVIFKPEDVGYFERALQAYRSSVSSNEVDVLGGSVTDFKLHGASAIVNAANMEVTFGGGLSGVVAKATRNAEAINHEAARIIRSFYQAQ